MGCAVPDVVVVDDWLVDREHWRRWRRELVRVAADHAAANPLDPRLSAKAARRALGVPVAGMLDRLAGEARSDGLVARDGWLAVEKAAPELPWAVRAALTRLTHELSEHPFLPPVAARLADWGLDRKALGAVVRAGQLLRLADGVFLLPDAPRRAADVLSTIEQPFTVSQARSALRTTRRVAVPLLELLDAQGTTVRVGNTGRYVRESVP
jgi:selenocysteine-specific elongation factor